MIGPQWDDFTSCSNCGGDFLPEQMATTKPVLCESCWKIRNDAKCKADFERAKQSLGMVEFDDAMTYRVDLGEHEYALVSKIDMHDVCTLPTRMEDHCILSISTDPRHDCVSAVRGTFRDIVALVERLRRATGGAA